MVSTSLLKLAAPSYDCETLSSRLFILYWTMRIHEENIAWLTWLALCIVHAINRITMINMIPSGYPVINTTHAHLTHWGHLRPRQNRHHFPDDILKWIFLNEKAWISIKISLKFVPKGQINSFGSDNGLALTRWQTVIGTNYCWITDAYMRHSASMS